MEGSGFSEEFFCENLYFLFFELNKYNQEVPTEVFMQKAEVFWQEQFLNVLKVRLYDQCVTLESEYLRMNFCVLKIMQTVDFWTWTKHEKEEICLEASKQANSCTSLISLVFAQLDRDLMKTTS
jgi:hypothetical protein